MSTQSSDDEHDERPWWNSDDMWFKGVVKDFKRTLGTHWCQEMTNLNQRTIAVSFFLFFAAITPAITFGGVYQKSTKNEMGAVELLLATAWVGVSYALFGGQPIIFNGGTGPILTVQTVIYQMAQSLDVSFLVFNAWCGLWITVFMIVAAFIDLNRVVAYATRFTDEIFAMMIAFIFIIDALGKPTGGSTVGVFHYFKPEHPSHDPYEGDPNYSVTAVALLSVILTLGTAGLAFLLKGVKQSPFCCTQFVRSMVTDFGMITTVVFWCLIDNLAFKDTPTERLTVPDKFAPTFVCCTEACDTNFPDDCPEQAEPWGNRPWLIDLTNVNGKGYVALVAAGPAILAFIMVFLDNGITWHLLYHPSHKLKHGEAFNYDTVMMGLMIGVNSILGMPWLVASTTPSVNHLHALSDKKPNGDIDVVQETRLSAFLVHALVTAVIFMLPLLRLVPMPVLYGVFLYMGLVSLLTNQFFSRVVMFFMQPSKYPQTAFTEEVEPRRMHLYTLIQLFLLAAMWTVKEIKAITILFPVVIASCVPIRLFIMPKWFSSNELVFLDSDEDVIATIRAMRGSAAADENALDEAAIKELELAGFEDEDLEDPVKN